MSKHVAEPTKPRWQFSLYGLLAVLTLLCLYFVGMRWLDATPTLMLLLLPVVAWEANFVWAQLRNCAHFHSPDSFARVSGMASSAALGIACFLWLLEIPLLVSMNGGKQFFATLDRAGYSLWITSIPPSGQVVLFAFLTIVVAIYAYIVNYIFALPVAKLVDVLATWNGGQRIAWACGSLTGLLTSAVLFGMLFSLTGFANVRVEFSLLLLLGMAFPAATGGIAGLISDRRQWRMKVNPVESHV